MPKLKTRSAAKKRMQVKKNGKVKHAKAFAKHLFTHAKSMDNRRNKRGTSHLNQSDSKRVTKEMFPYGAN